MQTQRYTLTLSCPDRVGIVAAVSSFLARHGGWIVEAGQHADQDTMRFFMRVEILAKSLSFDLAELRRLFTAVAQEFAMEWDITDTLVKKRAVILVSRQDHCLNDLLHRWRSGELSVEVPAVISNHADLCAFVEWHDIPFHHVPMDAANDKAAAFDKIARLFKDCRGDVMVLAKFMQILPPQLCQRYHGRIINIHHSFLPSFAGAQPYHQAFQRGVKLIGATCHYVTAELDAGPIIEQDTGRIDHGDSVDDMVRYGKDIEKSVLARGLRYHLEDRVLIDDGKTVVFK